MKKLLSLLIVSLFFTANICIASSFDATEDILHHHHDVSDHGHDHNDDNCCSDDGHHLDQVVSNLHSNKTFVFDNHPVVPVVFEFHEFYLETELLIANFPTGPPLGKLNKQKALKNTVLVI